MLAFLSIIPIIGPMIQGMVTAFFNSKVQITTAQIGGSTAIATQIIQAQQQQVATVVGSKILTLLVVAFALPLVIFEWKVVVIDIVFDAGTTAPIKGQVADWATTIIAFVFGAPTVVTLGRMFSTIFAKRI